MLTATEAASRAHTAQRGTASATERPPWLERVTVLGGSLMDLRACRLSCSPEAATEVNCSPWARRAAARVPLLAAACRLLRAWELRSAGTEILQARVLVFPPDVPCRAEG